MGLEYIEAIAVILIIIFAAFYATKFLARKSGGSLRKNANIRILGTLTLARDKSIAIVKIGESAYILGVSPQHVERIDKLTMAELDLPKEESPPPSFGSSFKDELSSRLKKFYKQ